MDIEIATPAKTRMDPLEKSPKETANKTSLRKMHLVIDFSQIMLEKDFFPNTIHMVLSKTTDFIQEFFELNPLSNMALSIMKDKKCVLLSNFKNNPSELLQIVENLRKKNSIAEEKFFEELNKDSEVAGKEDIPSGTISLENTLKATWELMAEQPLYYIREVLIIIGSVNTRDSFDLYDSIKKANESFIIVNMLSVIGSTHVYQQICQKTSGRLEVAISDHDFKMKLMV